MSESRNKYESELSKQQQTQQIVYKFIILIIHCRLVQFMREEIYWSHKVQKKNIQVQSICWHSVSAPTIWPKIIQIGRHSMILWYRSMTSNIFTVYSIWKNCKLNYICFMWFLALITITAALQIFVQLSLILAHSRVKLIKPASHTE